VIANGLTGAKIARRIIEKNEEGGDPQREGRIEAPKLGFGLRTLITREGLLGFYGLNLMGL
jgi:hypothetical protein